MPVEKLHDPRLVWPHHKADGSGRSLRQRLDEIGHEIMRYIAELLLPEMRGYYSDDPAIRAAARGTERYPWADKVEGQVVAKFMSR